jgi:hypothetical protein
MRKLIVVLTSAAFATACGSAAHPAAPASVTPKPTVSVDTATAGRVCAVLNALNFSGDTDVYKTVATALDLTVAQVSAAVAERCPQETASP